MPEFQMTHVALVGARINSFRTLGFHARSELTLCRAIPAMNTNWQELPLSRRRTLLAEQLPLWVHNVIADPEFPRRDKLHMALRRFEGELRDKRDDEVVAAVLSAGFRNQDLDPLDLPQSMPMRQRCSMLMQLDTWQDAYRALEQEISAVLGDCPVELDLWMMSARELDHAIAV